MGTGRIPPHNLDAEKSLLGAMLLSRDAIATATDVLGSADFYKPAHGHVFDAIVSLYAAGHPVDAVTVAEELGRADLLDIVGGLPALYDLQYATPATSNAGRYATIVEEHALLRRLIGVAGQIADIGYDTPEDVTGAVDRAESLIFEVAQRRRRGHQATVLRDALSGFLDHIEAMYEQGTPDGVPTGFHDLDTLLNNLHGGQLVSVAARPAMGKSSFAAASAIHAASQGHPVLFVSLEMGLHEVVQRIVSAESRVDLDRIRRGRLVDKDWPLLSRAVGSLADLPLHLEDDPAATLLSIKSSARRIAAKGGLGLIVVDYLQLMDHTERTENRQVEVAQLSRGLKRMALELNVPVMALAQLNRNLEYRTDKRPMLADLRESGAIENDSDVVLFLYRDEVYHPDSEDRGVAEVIVAKQRNGPTGAVRLAWLAQTGRFANMAKGAA